MEISKKTIQVMFWKIKTNNLQRGQRVRAYLLTTNIYLQPEVLVKRFFQIVSLMVSGFLLFHFDGCVLIICFSHAVFS